MLASLRTAPSLFLRPVTIARAYRRGDLRPDLIAGVTVAIVSLPQALAFAIIAGLPPVMGLYGAIIIPIVAALWGSLMKSICKARMPNSRLRSALLPGDGSWAMKRHPYREASAGGNVLR